MVLFYSTLLQNYIKYISLSNFTNFLILQRYLFIYWLNEWNIHTKNLMFNWCLVKYYLNFKLFLVTNNISILSVPIRNYILEIFTLSKATILNIHFYIFWIDIKVNTQQSDEFFSIPRNLNELKIKLRWSAILIHFLFTNLLLFLHSFVIESLSRLTDKTID